MKIGDIIRINGKPYQRICVNTCEFGTELRFKNIPLQLEYGKWYKCSDVMPEEIMDIIPFEDHADTGLVLAMRADGGNMQITKRQERCGVWDWHNVEEDVIYWMVIPPLDK